jgi:hypothetical protein
MTRSMLLLTATVLTTLVLALPLSAANEATGVPLRIGTLVEGLLGDSGTVSGRFTLELGASTASGKLTWKYTYGDVQRSNSGQTLKPAALTETLKAKSGTLVLKSVGHQIPVGMKNPRDPDADMEVWIGTWSIVKGTGKYAGLTGGGDAAGVIGISGRGLYLQYVHRLEGLVSTP